MRSLFHTIMGNSGDGATYLLDDYAGADVAFSVFKLSASYSGYCVRVRRSSDNSEQDFGFVNNMLDTSSLLSFVGANDGFIVKRYDQSGNVRDAIQTIAAKQPKIVSSGSLITRNGIPVISNNSGRYLIHTSLNYNSTTFSVFMDYEKDNSSNNMILGMSAGVDYAWLDYGANQISGAYGISASWTLNTYYLMSMIVIRSGTFKMFKDSVQLGSIAVGPSDNIKLGYLPASDFRTANIHNGTFVSYPIDQTTNRVAIETIINGYHGIY